MISIQNLSKSFGEKLVLDELSLNIASGEIYGLLGPNGSGKTTTINILCNLLSADSGVILVSGEPVSTSIKYLTGVAPQEISVYRDLTCLENLRFFAGLYGLSKATQNEHAETLIQDFQLGSYANTLVSNLSGGWQRRVNIAAALVHQPSVLILDEPTAALDVEARYELWDLIEDLSRKNVTVLLTTHHLEEAERLCSRIGIIRNGKIVAEGSLNELYSTIPASQLAVVRSEDEQIVIEKACSLGWQYRVSGGQILIWLPKEFNLKEFVDLFSGIPLVSVSLRQICLEDIYVEVTSH